MSSARPHYTNRQFPPYSYVPGAAPHPVSDPAGHMFGKTHETPLPLVPESWQQSPDYLYGIDLLNHGYYWEAHEAWETLWLVAGRQGRVADFLKGLIKLAAAGVKAREGNSRGVERHCLRAIDLLQSVQTRPGAPRNYCGVNLPAVIEQVSELARNASAGLTEPDAHLLLDIWIRLAERRR
ncbi:MAG: DUF309 domain-containing protein [Pirellulales bacterium]|nr:DUF309 domain-containing protein [Pirellulales bacterium]